MADHEHIICPDSFPLGQILSRKNRRKLAEAADQVLDHMRQYPGEPPPPLTLASGSTTLPEIVPSARSGTSERSARRRAYNAKKAQTN